MFTSYVFSFVVASAYLAVGTSQLYEAYPSDCVTADSFDDTVDYFTSKFSRTEYSPEFDMFPEKVTTDSTTDLFDITYHNHYKILTNHFANQSYLLYLCGTEPPESELDGRHHLVLPVPHRGGVALTSTTQIPYLELLGLRSEIIAYIGDSQWVSSPCMRYQIDVDESIEVISDHAHTSNETISKPPMEQFLLDNPDAIIFEGPYGDKDLDRAVIAAATQERSTVATFDWIGFYAAFFNMEGLSNNITDETKARYDCSRDNAVQLSENRPRDERPTVLWASYFWGYNWSVAECPTWDATYYCEYAAHCGANILSRPEGVGWNNPDFGGRYWYLNDDDFLELGKNADVFVYSSKTWDRVYEEKKDMLDQIKAVQNKQVYDTQGQGPNSWHEQRLAEYDVVALDFCELVETAATSDHQRRWFRNIFTEPVGSLEECNVPSELNERYVPKGAECTPMGYEGVEQDGASSGQENISGDLPMRSSWYAVACICYWSAWFLFF